MQASKNEMKKTDKIKSACKYVYENTPKLSLVAFSLCALAFFIRLACRLFPAFADFFVRYIAGGFRFVFANVSNVVPFSLAEIFLLLSPFLLAILIFLAVKLSKKRDLAFKYAISILSVIALLYFVFVFTFATGYHTSPIGEDFGLEASEVSANELKDTAKWLSARAGECADSLGLTGEEETEMPFSWKEMTHALNSSYESLNEEIDFVLHYYTVVKPVIFSNAMSYTGILGVHTFFTGEANVNTAYPDYTTVFTAAHEMAHQRGVSRENEANFVAFMVCINSQDEYIRYCGYVNMFEYVTSALFKEDASACTNIIISSHPAIKAEMGAYAEAYDKYDDTPIDNVSSAINNTYLEIQGTEGTKSYGMVVDLAVAYYRSVALETE